MPQGFAVNEDIEITPEMIEAGAVELSRFNSDFECLEDAVARIYRAMGGRGPRTLILWLNTPMDFMR